jgi:hypothetical protein
MATAGMLEFIASLPAQLKIAVTMSIYERTFKTNLFFKELKNRRLLAFIG